MEILINPPFVHFFSYFSIFPPYIHHNGPSVWTWFFSISLYSLLLWIPVKSHPVIWSRCICGIKNSPNDLFIMALGLPHIIYTYYTHIYKCIHTYIHIYKYIHIYYIYIYVMSSSQIDSHFAVHHISQPMSLLASTQHRAPQHRVPGQGLGRGFFSRGNGLIVVNNG